MTDKANPLDNVEHLHKSDAPRAEQAVERIPSTAGEISALASAGAPFTYFDRAEFFSIDRGTGGVTLSASRQIANVRGEVVSDRVIVCHLRAPLFALMALRDTLNALEKVATDQFAAAVAAAEVESPTGKPH